jgi:hypothetical protein
MNFVVIVRISGSKFIRRRNIARIVGCYAVSSVQLVHSVRLVHDDWFGVFLFDLESEQSEVTGLCMVYGSDGN